MRYTCMFSHGITFRYVKQKKPSCRIVDMEECCCLSNVCVLTCIYVHIHSYIVYAYICLREVKIEFRYWRDTSFCLVSFS